MSLPVLPGYKSVAVFAKKYNQSRHTVYKQLERGYCAWPQRQANGNTSHPLYSTWENMKNRCLSPTAARYSDYGGRGITVCLRWQLSFKDFLTDMGEKPSKEATLDRINNDGNYEPSNCRWASREEQVNNTRRGVGSLYWCKEQQKWRVTLKNKQSKRFKNLNDAKEYLAQLRAEYTVQPKSDT